MATGVMEPPIRVAIWLGWWSSVGRDCWVCELNGVVGCDPKLADEVPSISVCALVLVEEVAMVCAGWGSGGVSHGCKLGGVGGAGVCVVPVSGRGNV